MLGLGLGLGMMANSPNHCALMLASGCENVLPSSTFSESPSPPQVSSGVSWPSLSQKCVPVPLTLNIGSPCTTVDCAAITALITWSHLESSKYMIWCGLGLGFGSGSGQWEVVRVRVRIRIRARVRVRVRASCVQCRTWISLYIAL